MCDVEPTLSLCKWCRDSPPNALARLRCPVSRSRARPVQHRWDAKPLDVGEQSCGQHGTGKDGHADGDDQQADSGRQPCHDDGEAGDRQRKSAEQVTGVAG